MEQTTFKSTEIKKINKQKAYILSRQKKHGEKLAQFFRKKGMMAICFTHHKEFYLALSRSEGSFALISNHYDETLLTVMPDFIVKKFGCPVIIFNEEIQAKDSFHQLLENKSEVLSIKGGGFQQLHHAVKNYENLVEKQKKISVNGGFDNNHLNSSDLHSFYEDEAGKFAFIPIEEWWLEKPLPCHAYIHLEKNDKYLLFVRTGDKIRPEAFLRFRENYFSHLVIDKSDKELYLTYRLEHQKS